MSLSESLSPDRPADITRRTVVTGLTSMTLAAALPKPLQARPRRITLNDASGLNPTDVARHTETVGSTTDNLLISLKNVLSEASANGRAVCAAGARHSMGGQSLQKNGHAVSLNGSGVIVDPSSKTCRVLAGTRWHQVIAALNPYGLSPKVLQSNNDFSVASTFCVNAHGWAVPHGPFGSTVRQVRILLETGDLVTCSRGENVELFKASLGGYGLFGIIVDLDLDVVPDYDLETQHEYVRASDFGRRFSECLAIDPSIEMAYGRLSVAEADFLKHGNLTIHRRTKHQTAPHPMTSGRPHFIGLARQIYRNQVDSEFHRKVRWIAETRIGADFAGKHPNRNALLNTSVHLLENTDPWRTDILHEYFVEPEKFPDFLKICQTTIPGSGNRLLNLTLRWVEEDTLSVLSYAPGRRIAAVMAFSQPKTDIAESQMRSMTERMVDQVVDLGGSYYLPYRLHARPDQMNRAYPRWAEFQALKTKYDPKHRFQNGLWSHYAKP